MVEEYKEQSLNNVCHQLLKEAIVLERISLEME